MKRSRILIFTALILLLIFVMCSCKTADEEEITEATYYTVTFNSAGGSEVESQKVLEGGKISEPIEPEREGYIFDGWKRSDEKMWIFSNDTVIEDVTLTAKWIEASTVFSYLNAEGADGVIISELKSEYSRTIRVPSVIKGLKVIGIGEGVFEAKSVDNISKIILPEGVTAIGKNAFKDCAGIEIVLNGALTEVGEGAFFGCDGLKQVSFAEGLKEICSQGFSGCVGLTELRLPETLEKIGENAFEDCASIVFIVMHDTTKLANSAFIACDAIVTVYYHGNEESADAMFEDEYGNSAVADAKMYFYSAEKPSKQGSFWYTDEKGKIKIWN